MFLPMNILANDFLDVFRKWRIWFQLGWLDIKQRYRGSVLGPFWITLSMGVYVSALATVYSKLFHQQMADYIPFLTAGFLVWFFVSSVLIESPQIFISSRNYILQIKMSYLVYIVRLLWRNLIIFFHNAIIYIIVALYFRISPTKEMLYVIPGMFLALISMFWISLLLGLLGSRFRDIPQLVNSTIQVVFFISPITWMPKLLNPNSLVLALNPITYFMDIFRSPLLGHKPNLFSWEFCIGFTVIGLVVSLLIYATQRNKVPFWV